MRVHIVICSSVKYNLSRDLIMVPFLRINFLVIAAFRKIRVFLIVTALIPSLLPAQPEIMFERLSIEDGLSQSVVTSILQDKAGFIWIGTMDGLNRFDGYEFLIFRNDPEDTGSLTDNFIITLFSDSRGHLWIGTGKGLNRYNPRTGRFDRYLSDPNDPSSLSDNMIQAICEDRDGHLWIGTRSGLNRLDPASGKIIRYLNHSADPANLSDNYVGAVLEDREGRLWIGTANGGLNLFNRNTGIFSRFLNNPENPLSIASNEITALFEDKKGNVWVGTANGLDRINLKSGEAKELQFEHFSHEPDNPGSLGHPVVYDICEYPAGDFWIATYGGGLTRLVLPNSPSEPPNFKNFRNLPDQIGSLSHNIVTSVMIDKAGNLWAGTSGGGLNKANLKSPGFVQIQFDAEYNPKDMTGHLVFAICEDPSGQVWIGTRGGLMQATRKTGGRLTYRPVPDVPDVFRKKPVTCLVMDGEEIIWAGTSGKGLYAINTVSGKTLRFVGEKFDRLANVENYINTIMIDRKGNIWVGTDGRGAFRISRDDKLNPAASRLRYRHDPNDPNSLSHNSVTSISEDSEGAIWIGTKEGLNKLILDWGKDSPPNFQRFVSIPGNDRFLSHNHVLVMFDDKEDSLWVGTRGGGLNRLNKKTGEFKHYSTIDGLSDNTVFGILEDPHGCLWLSTNRGLSRFDPRSEQFCNFFRSDGLPTNEFATGAFFKNQSNRMYFGGINGLIRFDPSGFIPEDYPHPVVAVEIEISGQPFHFDPVPVENDRNRKAYEIKPAERLNFVFSILDYSSNPYLNQYAYKLEPMHSEWIFLENERNITLAGLTRGNYLLRVKGLSSRGLWSEEEYGFPIRVKAPFLLFNWLLPATAFILFSLSVFIFLKTNSQRKRSVQQSFETMDPEKMFQQFKLTPREQEIVTFLLQGKTRKDIINTLFISEHTVKNHISNIYKKLGVKNRLQVIRRFQSHSSARDQ